MMDCKKALVEWALISEKAVEYLGKRDCLLLPSAEPGHGKGHRAYIHTGGAKLVSWWK